MKFFKSTFTFLVFFLLSYQITAQTVPPALVAVLNNTLDSMRGVLNVKSLSAAIQFPDSSVWARAKGISSLNPTMNVTVDDAYLIGSVTKTITSACILQLADENVLSLNDSLHKWIDTIPFINPNITIRQLLRHQSGIYDVLNNPNCQPALIANQSAVWDAQVLIDTFIKAPLFQPGASWSYSNTNYFLLGIIIQKATGHPFYEELRSRFFTPLSMNTIATPAFETVNVPVAHIWLDITGDNITDDAHDFYFNYLALNSAAGAAGCYYATPTDISKWMRTYMRGDLLSPALMTEAKTTVTAPGLPGTTYGLGLMKKSFIGFQGFGHGGDLAYAASSWYFPVKDISISVFTNDAKNNSWTLAPVVSALLKSCNDWAMTSTTIAAAAPENFACTAFPNPFEKDLSIALHLPAAVADLQLVLTNSLGVRLATSQKHDLPPGDQTISLGNFEQQASGVYFVSVLMDGRAATTVKVVKNN